MEAVRIDFAETPVFRAASNIGGKVADHAQVMAIYAMLASMVMIVVYVWVRFQNIVFGLAAVVALVHDVLVTIAALAVSYYVADFLGWAMVDPFKISLDVVAALLTIVGFSINDTIVIFDRIREIKGKSPEVTADMVNKRGESDARPHDPHLGHGADRDDYSLRLGWARDPSVRVRDARWADFRHLQHGLYRVAVGALVAKARDAAQGGNVPRHGSGDASLVDCHAFRSTGKASGTRNSRRDGRLVVNRAKLYRIAGP